MENVNEIWADIFDHIHSRKSKTTPTNIISSTEKVRGPVPIFSSDDSNYGEKHADSRSKTTMTLSNHNYGRPNATATAGDASVHRLLDLSRDEDGYPELPPPLPPTSPPSELKRYDSADFLNNFENTENVDDVSSSDIKVIPTSVTRSEHASEFDSMITSSPYLSDSDDSDVSEVSGHYNLSAYYSVFKSEFDKDDTEKEKLPYTIDNLKHEVKTVRSKIKPGTVEDMKQIFAKRGKKNVRNKKSRKPNVRKTFEKSKSASITKTLNEGHKKDQIHHSDTNNIDISAPVAQDYAKKLMQNGEKIDSTFKTQDESIISQTEVDGDDVPEFQNMEGQKLTSYIYESETFEKDVENGVDEIGRVAYQGSGVLKAPMEVKKSEIVNVDTSELNDPSNTSNLNDKNDKFFEGGDNINQNENSLAIPPTKISIVSSPSESHTETTENSLAGDLREIHSLKLIASDAATLQGHKLYRTSQDLQAKEKSKDSCEESDTINKHTTTHVDFDSSGTDDSTTHAYLTPGNKDGVIDDHVTTKLTNICLSTCKPPKCSSNRIRVLTYADDNLKNSQNSSLKSEKDSNVCKTPKYRQNRILVFTKKGGNFTKSEKTFEEESEIRGFHTTTTNGNRVFRRAEDKLVKEDDASLNPEEDTETVTIVVLRELRSKMPERSSGTMPKTAESSEYIGGKKISTKITTSRSYDGDVVRSSSEVDNEKTEASDALAALAEAVAKINEDNKDEILPEINQSVTKLNGGNLVITTLTRKIVEEENVHEDTHSSGRGSPIQNKNQGNYFIVQDHKGDTYMVEDITDDSQESAYFSSADSRHTSESSGYYDTSGNNSPYVQGVHNLQAIGRSGIDYSTAEEVLLGLFNPNHSGEIVESGEYNYEKTHSGMSKSSQLQVQPYGYATDSSFNKKTTTLEYDKPTPQVAGPTGSSTVKTTKSSYELSAPWGADGIVPEGEEYNVQKQESMESTNVDQSGMSSMSAAYLLQSSCQVPPAPLPALVPYPVMPPLVVPEQPSIRLHKLDVTPNLIVPAAPIEEQKTVETETVECKNTAAFMSAEYNASANNIKTLDEVDSKKVGPIERPLYKTVALVKGPYDTPKWTNTKVKDESRSDVVDSKRYKILNSRASDETQEKSMSFNESHVYKVNRTENYEDMKERILDENQNLAFHYSSPKTFIANNTSTPHSQHRFKTEKHFQVSGAPESNKRHRSHIEVTRDNVDGGISSFGQNFEQREEKRYVSKKDVKADEFYRMNMEPIHKLNADASSDLHVVRGNILIKNTMEDGLDEFNDNINVFDNSFNLSKENPLYQSDEDIYRRFESERQQQQNQRRRVPREADMTFETVDRYTTSKEVKREPEKLRPRQNLSQILLSHLSTIDAKDIRQHIDVKHHKEDIYGDINFTHADGSRSTSGGTQNFDTVSEDIDLALRDGKAYITIKVTAERITPVDMEFNVWRKNQAIVTRLIEIDLLANEQRRRLYHKVMSSGESSSYSGHPSTHFGHLKPQETILSSTDTLNLFAEIMNASGGEGDNEDITVKTSQKRTVKPSDFLY